LVCLKKTPRHTHNNYTAEKKRRKR